MYVTGEWREGANIHAHRSGDGAEEVSEGQPGELYTAQTATRGDTLAGVHLGGAFYTPSPFFNLLPHSGEFVVHPICIAPLSIKNPLFQLSP